jgi:pyruvate/2-oxoglutarate dehydrogenase complex dihydrolipoamide dehydrogenase (E3) component
LRAGKDLWAIGDVTGVRLLTHVGKYQGEVVAANILGEPREANYDAIPSVVYTDPQAASVGATEARIQRHHPICPRWPRQLLTPAYAQSNGFLTLLSDGELLTGAYALGPEAGEWLQQATLAIRARVPTRCAARHHPAVPDLLGDLRRCPQSAAQADQSGAPAGLDGIGGKPSRRVMMP